MLSAWPCVLSAHESNRPMASLAYLVRLGVRTPRCVSCCVLTVRVGGYTRFHMVQVRGVPVLSPSPHSIVNGSRPGRVKCVIRTAARGVWLKRAHHSAPRTAGHRQVTNPYLGAGAFSDKGACLFRSFVYRCRWLLRCFT